MAQYEKRLQSDLSRIREQVRVLGDLAEKSLQNAVHALLTHNYRLANETVLADHPINRKMREIDRLCHGFIARHLPSAGHLRLISSIMRINIELERIGDYAVIISRESVMLSQPLSGELLDDVENIAEQSRRMLQQALTAFYNDSADAAKATMQMSASLESTLEGIYGGMTNAEYGLSTADRFAIFAALNQLKRVADQAKNLCEETVFALTGETKAMKVYRILFIDEENRCLSQMAEAIARKNHPNSGNYSSGGRSPAAALDPGVVDFLGRHGINVERALPKPLSFTHQELSRFHVIVSLQGPVRSYIESIPFHTSFIDWKLGAIPEQPDEGRYSEIYRELSLQIQELMELLRGEGAD